MRIKVIIGKVIYEVIAKHLPKSKAIGIGGLGKKLRAWCGKMIIGHVGQNINIERGADFSHNISIGDNSGLGINSRIYSGTTIGNNVMMGPECIVFTYNHEYHSLSVPMNQQGSQEIKPVVIEDDCWIGARVIILPGRHIGRGAIIGAGAVVTKDVPEYAIVGGNPARIVGSRMDNIVLK